MHRCLNFSEKCFWTSGLRVYECSHRLCYSPSASLSLWTESKPFLWSTADVFRTEVISVTPMLTFLRFNLITSPFPAVFHLDLFLWCYSYFWPSETKMLLSLWQLWPCSVIMRMNSWIQGLEDKHCFMIFEPMYILKSSKKMVRKAVP